MFGLDTSRRWRKWREVWTAVEIDWRTAYDVLPRQRGQRHLGDGWTRVADSCEVERFARIV